MTCSGVPDAAMPAAASAEPMIAMPMPGVAPEQLLDGDRQREPGRIVHHRLGHELPAVQPDLGRLLHDRVRELLALVPLVGVRAHHVFGEAVHPLLELELVFVECHREFGHGLKLPVGNPLVYSSVTSPIVHPHTADDS